MKRISAREELLNLQRSLYERIRADIDDYLGKPTASIARYRAEYNRELQDYDRLANKAELVREVIKSDIVYCGDYHTLRQSQRTVIKILREAVAQGRKVILGLEMVHQEDQKLLNGYMLGTVDEQRFLKGIQYEDTWNFDWPHYKQLFDFSKKHKLPVYGLNCRVPKARLALQKRDEGAARRLGKLVQAHPDALIFVLYGDLHVCSKHLPAATQHELKRLNLGSNRKQLTIYQNSEPLYWTLAARGLEQKVDVLKIADGRYCVMNTPPWVKLQTYLTWLENKGAFASDSEEFGDREDSYDYYHRMWDMADTIATFLNLRKEHLDEFNVFSSGDVEFLDFLNNYLKRLRSKNRTAVELLRAEVIYNGTSILPSEEMIYLSTLSVNKSAEKIAQFIHCKSSNSELIPASRKTAATQEALYFGRILLEAIGYIGSKIINYKRKCDFIDDYKKMLRLFKGRRALGRIKDQREMSRLVLLHHQCEQAQVSGGKRDRRWRTLYTQPPRILYGITQAVGQMLGERLYQAVIDNHIDKTTLRRLFLAPININTDNRAQYFEFLELVRKLKTHYRSKAERF